MEWNTSNCFITFKTFAHSMEPGETPSNSASHQAPHYLPIGIVLYVDVNIRSIYVENRMERTGTGTVKCQLIIFSSVPACLFR